MKAIAAVLALAVGCVTMGADRTAQHWKRRGKVKEAAQTQDVRLSVAHGVNSDGNAQIIPLTDASNMVMVRDGTALTPREGLEIRKHYNLTSGYGASQMVILKESAPPDVELGNMFLQIDPSNGLQTVVDIEFMRDRTQLEGESITSVIWMEQDGYATNPVSSGFSATENFINLGEIPTATTITLQLIPFWYRTGDLSQPVSLKPVPSALTMAGGRTIAQIQADIDAEGAETIAAGATGVRHDSYLMTLYDSGSPAATGAFSITFTFTATTGNNYTVKPEQASILVIGEIV